MTGNSKEIKKLKHQQAKKKEHIKRYKGRRKKHIYFITIPLVAYILFNIEGSYMDYGNIFIFIGVALAVLVVLIISYLLAVRYLIRQREREIKIIRSKLYHLMKLDND